MTLVDNRTGTNPMQVISGAIDIPKVHFEAPPSEMLPRETHRFLDWFRSMHPAEKILFLRLRGPGSRTFILSAFTRSKTGNCWIGRAIAEKSLAGSLGHPTLIAFSQTINSRRKLYYDSFLKLQNQSNEIHGLVG